MTLKDLIKAEAVLRATAARKGVSVETVKKKIQEAIDAAWANPAGREAQQRLFPDGKPTPEEMVIRLGKLVKGEL